MHNIKLVIAYDGRNYMGWQSNGSHPTIEDALQTVIEKILQRKVVLQAASRTDAGVHANGQVVNFLTPDAINLHRFLFSLNRLLPKDIIVFSADEVPVSFHPTIDCTGKEYHYYICYGARQLPSHRFYSWHVPYDLNLTAIKQALPELTGTHDFRAFCNVKKNRNYVNCVRHIQLLELETVDTHRLRLRVKGNHFLYRMVRNMVGTLIDHGRGKFAKEDLTTILSSKERPQAGISAPAHGLFLHQVFYPETFNPI
jgi:tRNA pseudouridine38-40 synthase